MLLAMNNDMWAPDRKQDTNGTPQPYRLIGMPQRALMMVALLLLMVYSILFNSFQMVITSSQSTTNSMSTIDVKKRPSSRNDTPARVINDNDDDGDASMEASTVNQHSSLNESIVDAFRLEDVDLEKTKCGGTKCIFLLKRNAQLQTIDQQEIGYLVGQEGSRSVQRKSCMKFSCYTRIWQFAQSLSKKYNASTLLLEEPREVILNGTNAFVKSYMNNVWKKAQSKYKPDKPFILQPTAVISQPNLMLQRYFDKDRVKVYPDIVNYLTDFLHNSNVTKAAVHIDDEINSSIRNNHGQHQQSHRFCQNFAEDMKTLKSALNDPKCKWLGYDFQVILDSQGRLHHIDLDRFLEIKRKPDMWSAIALSFLHDTEIAFQRTFDALNVTCHIIANTTI